MYKTETHLHTSESSRCGRLTAAEMVELYHEKGYSTIFISDHFTSLYYTESALSWSEKVDRLYLGYEAARARADELGLIVLPSLELQLNRSPNHYLLYGADREYLYSRPSLFDMTAEELYADCKENGITVVQAHPYRDMKCYPTPDAVDAIEAINPNPRHDNHKDLAKALADEHNLPITSGSDAHRPEDIARGGVMTEERITSAEDYIEALLCRQLTLIGGELS